MRSLIFLTGFMGSGKSTVGRLLAKKVGVPHVDVDVWIQKREGRKVSEIFAADGEAGFRGLESAAIREITASYLDEGDARWPRLVISLGGGALISLENRSWILKNGMLVYLKASVATLAKRVRPGLARRPLLAEAESSGDPSALEVQIAGLMSERSAIYEQAQFCVETDGKDVAHVVTEVWNLLNESGE